MTKSRQLSAYYSHLNELALLNDTHALLHWDQQVMMPPQASEYRARQLELVAKLIHSYTVRPDYSEVLEDLYESLDDISSFDDRVNIRESYRTYQRAKKLPVEFVGEITRATSECYQIWTEARPRNDFKMVAPALERVIGLKRRESNYVGYTYSPYDVHLDEFEPGSTAAIVVPLLGLLADRLRPMLPSIIDSMQVAAESDITREQVMRGWTPELLRDLCARIVSALGFSFEAGRMDESPHPFMTSVGTHDIRITARFGESDLLAALYGAIHETGHALYHKGLPTAWYGTPRAAACSYGIDESQSRLWENLVGRSRPFMRFVHRVATDILPEFGERVTADGLYSVVNSVRPSFIRIEADEVTYSLHIAIRMMLEKDLLEGSLSVADLPERWNELYEHYLGVTPPTDTLGVLQDVHWYSGLVGYFPSYALGNLYGAQMLEVMQRDIGPIEASIEQGLFDPIRRWLEEHVHQHGRSYTANTLIERISKAPLSVEPFLLYLKTKFAV
jgi:carboxypeptidase Taq